MEKVKQMVTGKSKEEREAEHLHHGTGAGLGTSAEHPTYGERGALGAGGTEYTGGAAGGPAYGTAVGGRCLGGWGQPWLGAGARFRRAPPLTSADRVGCHVTFRPSLTLSCSMVPPRA